MKIYRKLKLGIVGHGFVGKATDWGFNKRVSKFIVDPLLDTNIEDLKEFEPEIVFICVPTPMSDDGTQDITIVEETISKINQLPFKPLVVVKSSVIPSLIEAIESECKKFVYNPEFLREKHANQDFVDSTLILFGGKKDNCNQLANFYNHYTKCKSKEYFYTDTISASLCKYAINSFLATKVIFFNELKSIFDKSGASIEWKDFIYFLSKDIRIGSSHMEVPGHDGRKGYGGACFPKDTNALLQYSKTLDEEFSLLKKAVNINNFIRGEYNELTDREKEQNVNFINEEVKKK